MCTENKVEYEAYHVNGYKIFAKVDGRLYSPFVTAHHPDDAWEYEAPYEITLPAFNEIGINVCNSDMGFHVCVDYNSALAMFNYPNWNFMKCANSFVLASVRCQEITHIGQNCDNKGGCNLVMHAKSLKILEVLRERTA